MNTRQFVHFARVEDSLHTPAVRSSGSYEVGWVIVNDNSARYRITCDQGYFPNFNAKRRELTPNWSCRCESIPPAGTQICIILDAINEVSWWFDPEEVTLPWGWWNVVDPSWEGQRLARLLDLEQVKNDGSPYELYLGSFLRAREIMRSRNNRRYLIEVLVSTGDGGSSPQWIKTFRS